MYTVREAVRGGKREAVVVEYQGKFVGGASLSFIQWMQQRVPHHQLTEEQLALVKWYEDKRLGDDAQKKTQPTPQEFGGISAAG
jgi:hypothetical protein